MLRLNFATNDIKASWHMDIASGSATDSATLWNNTAAGAYVLEFWVTNGNFDLRINKDAGAVESESHYTFCSFATPNGNY